MSKLTEKETLLENAGYRYHFDRMIYFNRDTRKALSLEFVEDHSYQELQQILDEPPQNGWAFYFNKPPSHNIRLQLIGALER